MFRSPRRIAVLLTAIVLALLFMRSNDEDVILKQLEEMRVMAEVRTEEHPIEALTKARSLSKFFTEQTVFDFTNADYRLVKVESRQMLAQKIMQGRAALNLLELGIRHPEVVIRDDEAEVELQGSALGSMPGEDGKFLDIHRVKVFLKNIDGDWLVSGAEHIRNERE